jgi:hypothetical protein
MRDACKHRNKYGPILKNSDVGWIEWCRDCGAIRTMCYHTVSYNKMYVKTTIKSSKWKIPTKVF